MKPTSLQIGAAALPLMLSACGGGGGGGVASISPPPQTPTPTPSPTPTPTPTPIPLPGPIGLTGAASFATYSAHTDASGNPVSGKGGVEFSYSAPDNSYTVKLPGFDAGKLVTVTANGVYDDSGLIELTSTINRVTDGNSTTLQPVEVALDAPGTSGLQYTSMAQWMEPKADWWHVTGLFVYGIPTAAGDMPVTGSADYSGTISGITNGGTSLVFGSIDFSFDFGAGTLSGKMEPFYAPVYDDIGLGTYTFTNTVYSTGSTSFSGSFIAPPGADGPSSFEGTFNGPKAVELMGSWKAPFKDPVDGTTGTMSGVLGGSRGP